MPPCDICEKFAEKNGEQTPCDECFIECAPENQDAVDVYFQCANQVLFGPDGRIIGINHVAVDLAIDRAGVDNKVECFNKVLILEGKFLLNKKDNSK